jgi:hypothetical protein
MRLVLDTNVVVSALLWKGAPRRLLGVVADAGVGLFTSMLLLVKLAEVLSRAKFKTKISGLGFSPGQFFDSYAKRAEVVQAMSVPRLAPDPGDDAVIGTALAAKADLVVTGDRTLLSVAEYEGVRIVSVGEAMKAVARQSV